MEKNQTPADDLPELLADELRRQAALSLDDLTADELNLLCALAEDEGPRQAVESFIEGDL